MRFLRDRGSTPAVMLVHGQTDSSDTWVMNTKENSIGFILADAGYDVWMVNHRCNGYSYQHTTLNSRKDWQYWDRGITPYFSKYDWPAFLEYARENSNV